MPRNLLFYIALLLIMALGIYAILGLGAHLETTPAPPEAAAAALPAGSPTDGFLGALGENLRHPLSLLLLQFLVIVAAAKALGRLFARIRQPPVIGEMVAGLLLGPSLLGLVAPGVQTFLFPASGMEALRLLSQIGVILFMFVVGIELDVRHLRQKAHAALLVSHASIVLPLLLGMAGALFLYRSLAPEGIPFTPFALFLGVSMSITAFPVLARILEDRGMSTSSLGNTAIACAAVGDVTAWCLLAVVVALAQVGGPGDALLTIVPTLAFIAGMLLVVRPWADRVARRLPGQARNGGLLAVILLFVFASSLFTEVIGVHALFGAFLAGVCMPQDAGLRQFLRERLETFSSVFLLPLFFAFTGLRTQVSSLDDWWSWLVCAGIIALAIAGKLGGSLLAARWTGMSWGDSIALGVLMNTRGLVELIVLDIGYDLGLLSPRIFTMLVLMALVTTFMTGPLLQVLEAVRRRAGAKRSARLGTPGDGPAMAGSPP